ncbi:MAG: hypothetical protein FJ010_05475 [Chloroflexi bacterium]|nr:hypothetical protein [Chloroflexota bacterium]
MPHIGKSFLILTFVVPLVLAACVPAASDTSVLEEESLVTQPPANPNLILATTTSTQDSGLLDVLVPMFQEKTGYVVQTVAVGSGAALKMAEEGNADVLLVHAPASEETLMDAGLGKDRLLVMHNDFVIVGPRGSQAHRISPPHRAGDAGAIVVRSICVRECRLRAAFPGYTEG